MLKNLTTETKGFDEAAMLDKVSHEKAMELLPLDITFVVLSIIGAIGNILVFLFFNKKTQRNPTNRLISALAVVDTCTCLVIPATFEASFRIYKSDTALCALGMVIGYFFTLCSGGFLFLIGMFRFKLVIMPLKTQFSLRQANYLIGIAVVVAMALSSPTLMVYHSVPYNIVINENITIVGYECNSARHGSLQIGFEVTTIFQAIYLLTILIGLVTMYAIMGWDIRKRRKRLEALTGKQAIHYDNPGLTTDEMKDENTCQEGTSREIADVQVKDEDKYTGHNKTTAVEKDGSTLLQKLRGISKVTKLCFFINISFLISFVPIIVIMFYKDDHPNYDAYSLLSKSCYRSFLLNNLANPIIYGFFNRQFKDYAMQIFTRCCKHKFDSCCRKEMDVDKERIDVYNSTENV